MHLVNYSFSGVVVWVGLLSASVGCSESETPPVVRKIECESPNPRKDRYGEHLPPCAEDRLGEPRTHHGQFVTSVAFSSDGLEVVSGARRG